jgi:hypothetical protein
LEGSFRESLFICTDIISLFSEREHEIQLKLMELKCLVSLHTSRTQENRLDAVEVNPRALKVVDDLLSITRQEVKAALITTARQNASDQYEYSNLAQVLNDLRSILLQRIRFLRTQSDWQQVVEWSDRLRNFSQGLHAKRPGPGKEDPVFSDTCYSSLSWMHKCDALLNLGSNEEATTAALEAAKESLLSTSSSTVDSTHNLSRLQAPRKETLVQVFKSALSYRGGRTAVECLLHLKNIPPSTMSSLVRIPSIQDLRTSNDIISKYQQILIRANVAADKIPKFNAAEDKSCGRSEWLHTLLLCASIAWEGTDVTNSVIVKAGTDDSSPSFFLSAVREDCCVAVSLLLQLWLLYFAQEKCWRLCDSHKQLQPRPADSRNESYFSVLIELIQHYTTTKLTPKCLTGGARLKPVMSESVDKNVKRKRKQEEVSEEGLSKRSSEDDEFTAVASLLNLKSTSTKDVSAPVVAILPETPSHFPSVPSTSEDSMFHVLSEEEAGHVYLSVSNKPLVADINVTVVPILLLTMELLRQADSDRVNVADCIGSDDEIKWVADTVWNMSLLLLKKSEEPCDLASGRSVSRVCEEDAVGRLGTAALLLEIAEQLYCKLGKMISSNTGQSGFTLAAQRCLCLTRACAARLDADTLLQAFKSTHAAAESKFVSAGSCDGGMSQQLEVDTSRNLTQIKDNIKLVESLYLLLPRSNKLNVNCTSSESLCLQSISENPLILKNMMVLFSLTVACKSSSQTMNLFIQDNAPQLLQLTSEQLLACAHITSLERKGGCTDNTRTLLTLALQVATRDSGTSASGFGGGCGGYGIMGHVYCRLIELSASRKQAVETIEEFAQLLQTTATVPNSGCGAGCDARFSIEDVDRITVLAYNYAVTLGELDDVVIAERFISQSLVLVRYASASIQQWLPRMQVSEYSWLLFVPTAERCLSKYRNFMANC